MDDANLRFDFRASTPATSRPERGAEHRGGDGAEQRRIEPKKFSLRPEKYDGKGDFEGWVNQYEEYATLGQWNEEEKASLLFLSLTHGRAPTVHHPLSHRGEGGNGRNSCGPGCGVGNTGTTHRHAGKGDRSYSQSRRDGDD